MKENLTVYRELLADIRARVRDAQRKVALSANAELVRLYWGIGQLIDARQRREGWGTGVIPRLAIDLKNELPEDKGFSARNIARMVAFYRAYPILPQPAAEMDASGAAGTELAVLAGAMGDSLFSIPWFHHVILLEKVKHLPTRLWYARKVLERGWSRDTLTEQIRHRAHEREGAAVTNFGLTLPGAHAELAQGLLKDPYVFDFLTLGETFHERELETGLLAHVQKFLLELGRGFAFVGRQVRLEVSETDYYIDLLFYHLQLRCFIVIDLKRGAFKPEYAGKMNFYCSVVDDQLRHAHDAVTIGLILCQTQDRVIAEYALRDIQKPIGVADYELARALPAELASSLPSIEAIEAELSREMAVEEES
jgi:predicted nuclease of restriction endonuclease-like (RecB) superfamily